MDPKKLSAATRALIVVLALLATPVLAAGGDESFPEPRIAQPGSHPGGKTYGEWAARWWQWAFETPLVDPNDPESHPITDPTGKYCDVDQLGHVWFLGGTFASGPAERECTIPVDTALFFPLINAFYGAFLSDPPEQRAEEFLRAQADCEEPTELVAEIDGVAVDDPFQYFTGGKSPLFEVQLPEDNVLGLGDDVVPELRLSPSAESGYYLFLFPLPPGKHTIHWSASWSCPFPPGDFTEEVTYDLRVVP